MPDSIAEYLLHLARSADAYDRHERSDDEARAAMREFGLNSDKVEAFIRAKSAGRAGIATDVARELQRTGAERGAREPNLGEERTGYIRQSPEPPTPVPPPPPPEPPVEPPPESEPGAPEDQPGNALYEATRR